MNIEQLHAAEDNMIKWLADPHELGKRPYKIECTGDFELHEMHYYIFKYKVSMFGQWLVGVSGGFENDGTVPCGHTFSNMQKFNAASSQNDCIVMVEKIREYWMEQAMKYSQQQ